MKMTQLLTETQKILKKYNIKPKKRMGQNFLIDSDVLDKQIVYADLQRTDIVLVDSTNDYYANTNWEIASLSDVSGYVVVENSLFIVNDENYINIIDLENGNIEKNVNVNIDDVATSPRIAVSGNYLSINYYEYVIVYDYVQEKIVNSQYCKGRTKE